MICITAGLLPLRESNSVAALRKPAVRSRDVLLMNSDELRIKEDQRSNAERMKIIIPQKLHIIHRSMVSHQITCHPCSKGHQYILPEFMSCHHHHHLRLLHQRSIQVMTESKETVSIILPHHLRLGNRNVLRERWTLMKIMTMMEKKIRKEALCQRRGRGQVPHQET
jgi:hypothetical protein